MTVDPFGTAAIRDRVLTAWAASPARFREDANAEEDLALGGYRDRLVVELAQNAADAAVRAGVPGRLLFALRELDGRAVLVAANTGAALDAAGVQALATLRASAKRDGDTVGRFGVGFAAVLAVTDEPAVVGRGGGVRFGAADTRQLVELAAAGAPGLRDELTRRDGGVPVLRLPFAAEGTPPTGYATAVLLPLRDAVAEDLVVRLLDGTGDPLLLALPALDEVVVELPGRPPRVLAGAGSRWHVLRAGGRLDPALLADRPTEERGRTGWQVTWAMPAGAAGVATWGGVVHAPTPTDEPLPWPALLIASFPLDAARRHVAAGPATDALVRHAARAYAELLVQRAAEGADAWALLPTGLPSGSLDGALRAALEELVPGLPLLPSAEDPGVLVRPRDAAVLAGPAGADRGAVAELARWVGGLVQRPAAGPPLAAYDVRSPALADVVEALPAVADPARWREVYAALAPLAADPLGREALAALPVPLADGRVVRGVRGAVLVRGGDGADDGAVGAAAALALLGVRTVHPEAEHPVLERLGAVPASARAVLDLPAVRSAVEASLDGSAEVEDGDGPGVTGAVLDLVRAAVRAGSLDPGDLPWLGELALTDADGDVAPASALVLPGSAAAGWFDPADVGVVASELVDRWGADVLAAVGVLDGPALLRADDVPLEGDAGPGGSDPGEDLPGWDGWCELVEAELEAAGVDPAGAVVNRLVALRDLDLVLPQALPELLGAVAGDPVSRESLVRPARVVAAGRSVDVTPYSAWWLRQELGAPLADRASDPELATLLPAAPAWPAAVDAAVRRALGVVTGTDDLDGPAAAGLLDRLADPDLEVSAALLLRLVARLATLAAGGAEVTAGPDAVRVPDGTGTRVVAADGVVLVASPMFLQRPDLGAALPVPAAQAAALADLLDLPLAGELARGEVAEAGEVGGAEAEVPAEVVTLLPGCPPGWCEHETLLVDGVEVDWWVDAAGSGGSGGGPGESGLVHAATLDGLARGLAWAAGAWHRRAAVAELLANPGVLPDLLVDEVFTP